MANSFGISWIPWIVLGFFGTGNILEKIQFFRLVLELFLNSIFLQSIFYVTKFPLASCLDLLFVIKYYFNSVWGNLYNRPSIQLTVSPNRSWMPFSKLSYVLDALWPIDHDLLPLQIIFLYFRMKMALKQGLCHLWSCCNCLEFAIKS